jgi:hypothetical protein
VDVSGIVLRGADCGKFRAASGEAMESGRDRNGSALAAGSLGTVLDAGGIRVSFACIGIVERDAGCACGLNGKIPGAVRPVLVSGKLIVGSGLAGRSDEFVSLERIGRTAAEGSGFEVG